MTVARHGRAVGAPTRGANTGGRVLRRAASQDEIALQGRRAKRPRMLVRLQSDGMLPTVSPVVVRNGPSRLRGHRSQDSTATAGGLARIRSTPALGRLYGRPNQGGGVGVGGSGNGSASSGGLVRGNSFPASLPPHSQLSPHHFRPSASPLALATAGRGVPGGGDRMSPRRELTAMRLAGNGGGWGGGGVGMGLGRTAHTHAHGSGASHSAMSIRSQRSEPLHVRRTGGGGGGGGGGGSGPGGSGKERRMVRPRLLQKSVSFDVAPSAPPTSALAGGGSRSRSRQRARAPPKVHSGHGMERIAEPEWGDGPDPSHSRTSARHTNNNSSSSRWSQRDSQGYHEPDHRIALGASAGSVSGQPVEPEWHGEHSPRDRERRRDRRHRSRRRGHDRVRDMGGGGGGREGEAGWAAQVVTATTPNPARGNRRTRRSGGRSGRHRR